MNDDELVDQYLGWCRAEDAAAEDSPEGAAWATFDALTSKRGGSPERAWDLLLRVVDAARSEQDEFALCSLGSDALEALFRNYGDQFIDRFERQARIDPKFRKALACIWCFDSHLRSRFIRVLRELNEPLWP